jgi:hypothetical protein
MAWCGVRAVFALAPHLVIQDAVLVRLDVLAALEVEGKKHAGALAFGPADEIVVVVFLEHGFAFVSGRAGPVIE